MFREGHYVTEGQLEKRLTEVGTNLERHNGIFEAIANEHWLPSIKLNNHEEAEHLWQEVLTRTTDWEKISGIRVHKGTPYYFYAVTCLIKGNAERGFLLMHRALEEDVETTGLPTPNSPAWKFVTLDYNSVDHQMYPLVVATAGQIKKFLDVYQKQVGRVLRIEDFERRFLRNLALREQVFAFTHQIFELKDLLNTSYRLDFNSPFGSFRLVNRIFTLCLIVDSILDLKADVDFRFINKAKALANQARLLITRNELERYNGSFINSFGPTIDELLKCEQSTVVSRGLTIMERSLFLTYGFRNHAAHKIEEQLTVNDNFREIVQFNMNVLFCAIEVFP